MVKVLTLLKALSPKELKLFRQFVESPFFNKRSDVVKLMDYWEKNYRNFSKEIAYESIFLDKKFNTQNWHLLTSRLFKLGEQFLSVNEMLQDSVDKKSYLSKAYRKKKLEPLFQSTIKDVRKELDKQNLRDANWLQQNFIIENEFYDYIASHDRKNRTNLQVVNDTLDKYFFSNKLKTACLAISRRTINQEDYDVSWLEEVLHRVEGSEDLMKEPTVAVYYYCYKAITETGEEQWFTPLREAMAKHQHRFSPTERRDILLLAINYCILRLNTGSSIFIREALELYRLSLDEGVLLQDGVLPESTFNNILMLASRLKEFDWAYQFVEQNRQFLKPVFQDPLYYFSLGKLHYEQGRYDESLRSLAMVDTKTSFLLLGTKTLQLKIFYEQNEFDALESLLETLRVYLQRKKDLGYRKTVYGNFFSFVRKLLEKESFSQKERKAFIKEVKATKKFSEKEWVLKQLNAD